MNFSEIATMPTIIDHISSSSNRSRFEYRVWVYSNDKNRSAGKQPIQKLRFGNLIQDQFSIDIVNISVYQDQIDLHCVAEGAKHHIAKFDQTKSEKISLENKLMSGFDRWSSYFRD
ncbi:hypothetical protein [Paenibacillus amylolyticus]|uniref:hypothetical protein n=1 Tax=Paenibacillus amylolyticus TaxID=1451 RepID=UPI00201DF48D|nr:hypothetical protein [Paenibacillus amylolyticus]MCL6663511.1 hypothetical protein [Paenibacillus amylolyticus]